MTPDPMLYIIAAAVLGAAIGFFACALVASRRIRDAEREGWKAGVRCRHREEAPTADPCHLIR
jgi:hypothetical protein